MSEIVLSNIKSKMLRRRERNQFNNEDDPSNCTQIESRKSETKLSLSTTEFDRTIYLTNDRIVAIKKEVEEAIKMRKIFFMGGQFRSIKRALLDRGWVEKIPIKSVKFNSSNSQINFEGYISNSSNELTTNNDSILDGLPEPKIGETLAQHLKKCELAIKARMLQSHAANFYWNIKKDSLSWMNSIPRDAYINRFPRARFTTKEGLCAILQQMHWYTEPGVAFIRFPRCYNLSYPDQLLSFVDDYRITACMSLLKSFLNTLATEGEIGIRSLAGTIPMAHISFAIERCKEYIATAEHDDIDQEFKKIWDHEWENFFTSCDMFVNQKRRFALRYEEESVDSIKEKVEVILKQMVEYWPQYNLDGDKNIWIVKPGNRCRGQGIILMDKFQSIISLVINCNPKKNRYVVQKYVERPLLIYNTKFDIRQWFLLTSAQPLILWMYKECYLRFSTQLFSLDNFHESIHLTNNAVQKKYRNQPDENRSKELPDENMWDCYTFKTYLRRIGEYEKWDNFIYPAMKEAIIGTMLASQDNMDRRGNYFELYGADFIVGQDLVPWLLEINSSPDMSSSTSVTSRMCAQCLEDLIKVVIDRREDPMASTGLFELIYRQQCPRPPAYLGLQLTIRGRRILRHKIVKVTHTKLRSSESLPRRNAKTINKIISEENKKRYHGPVIADFIEEIQKKINGPLNKNEHVPRRKEIKRRKCRTSVSRAERRTVHHFQPTINTIQMRTKNLTQSPFCFSVPDRNELRKPQVSKCLTDNLTLNPLYFDSTINRISKSSSQKINHKLCHKSASEYWKSKQNSTNAPQPFVNKKKVTTQDIAQRSESNNNNHEVAKDTTNPKGTCPRLVRSMYDNTANNKPNLSKNILQTFLTVGLHLNNFEENNNNLKDKIIVPLQISGTNTNAKAKT